MSIDDLEGDQRGIGGHVERPGAHDLHRPRPSISEPFESAIKAAERLEDGISIEVPIEIDEKGYFDRRCPADNCGYEFKVHLEDWKQQIETTVHCPMCRMNEAPDQWMTQAQHDVAMEHAKQAVEQMLLGGFAEGADSFNRSQRRNSLIQLSMQVTIPELKDLPPLPSSDAYRIEIQCEDCRCRFSVLGSAYFCPCCGRSSVERTFVQSILIMRTKTSNARLIRDGLTQAGKPDAAVDIERELIESCVKDSVTDFQCLCDALYAQKRPTEKLKKNVFQRLVDGSDLWRALCGEGYEQWLSAAQLRRLVIFYQRRHLLSHCDGIVDQEYLDKSGDTTYAKGQRIVVSVAEAEEMVALVEELANRLRAKIAAVP
jgi:hypothetical protein